ncbi:MULTISPECIES: 2Fe-2S iron-sulfur cluster-binding protein [Pacificibacter]|uniref:2Fe-2S iron-sulfur cluster-binding protein n=1 Tax=Pacificibacter TaxID=1042323 RepID=UPI001C08A454|nr:MULTISPECIES: 2Fe-2S iron-sulfur cluster-binding protein [Pacificibacter]MBU2936355.1 2Fe-2S iron-sulfur cluster binding domain-containing protein [Pacificibacter marinus]MDO6616607.1 2Fe-2S iron-sulfur cluster-binding protein [Pacificibacter sp. 1_MG-2023]
MKVTFQTQDESKTVTALAGQSLMEVALANNINGIAAECGGGAICGTCHVKICEKWQDAVGPAEDFEEDLLDCLPDFSSASRLACQVLLTPEFDGLEVNVPKTAN